MFRFGLTDLIRPEGDINKNVGNYSPCITLLCLCFVVIPLCVCRYLVWPTAATSHLWGGQEKVLIALVFLVYLVLQELLGSQVM